MKNGTAARRVARAYLMTHLRRIARNVIITVSQLRHSPISVTLTDLSHAYVYIALSPTHQGCRGAGTRGDGVPPLFSTWGTRPPLPHFFGLKFVQKLVHCCNWLLTETQSKIISVQHVCRPKLLKKSLSCFRRPPTSFL